MKLIKFEENVKLSNLNTIKIGGIAKKVYIPKTAEDIKILLDLSKQKDKLFFPVGIGSNTVFSDGILDHIFVLTRELNRFNLYEKEGKFYLEAEAGVSFKTIIRLVQKFNLKGFEWLSGIPATVGGAVVMNAGAFGTEVSDIIYEVHWLNPDGEYIILKRDEIDFSYRKSPFQNNGFVFKVIFQLEKSNTDIRRIIKNHLLERNKKQPLDYPTAGSTFKNPQKFSAGYLLEKVGLKGFKVGNVAFSEKHANFVINLGGGKYKELKKLIEIAEKKVASIYHINLEKEIQVVE